MMELIVLQGFAILNQLLLSWNYIKKAEKWQRKLNQTLIVLTKQTNIISRKLLKYFRLTEEENQHYQESWVWESVYVCIIKRKNTWKNETEHVYKLFDFGL